MNFNTCPKCKIILPNNYFIPVLFKLPNGQPKKVMLCKNCVENLKSPREL